MYSRVVTRWSAVACTVFCRPCWEKNMQVEEESDAACSLGAPLKLRKEKGSI